MRTLFALEISGLVCLATAACGSKDGSDGESGTGAAPGYSAGTGGGSSSSQHAQDTTDGLSSISVETATSVVNSDCRACACESSVATAGGKPILEFVIDASGSMSKDPANPNQPNSPSKWEVFAKTMPSVFQSLPSNFAVGVSYYNKGDSGCFKQNQPVPIGVLDSTQLSRVVSSIQNTKPSGYTPTYAAWRAGIGTVSSWTAAGYEKSPRYLVLITDGVPTVTQDGCTNQSPITQAEYDAELTAMASELQAAQTTLGVPVKTFVVGVVGSENPQKAKYDPLYMLSRMAVIGGTAPSGCTPVTGTPSGDTVAPRGTYCHFDLSQAADFGTALTNTLGTIAESVVSCDYSVPTPSSGNSVDPNRIVLVYTHGDGTYSLVLQNTSTTCDKGWQFTDSTNSKIHICGTTCDMIQKNPKAQLNLVYGCSASQLVN